MAHRDAVDAAQAAYDQAATTYKNLSDAYEAAKTENGGDTDNTGNTGNGTTGTEGGSTENGSTGDNSGSAGENGGNAEQSGTDQTANAGGQQAADGAATAQGTMPQTGDSTLFEVSVISGMGAAAIAAAGIARRRGLHAAL